MKKRTTLAGILAGLGMLAALFGEVQRSGGFSALELGHLGTLAAAAGVILLGYFAKDDGRKA